MERAKISEIRDRLSYYLRRVREGESVEILDREDPVARLVPIPPASQEPEAWMHRLRRAGIARVGPMNGLPTLLDRKPQKKPVAGVLQALLEERTTGR
jgi:prevent-host-death family protein